MKNASPGYDDPISRQIVFAVTVRYMGYLMAFGVLSWLAWPYLNSDGPIR